MTFAGIDPIYEPVPVRPGAHYHMGGVSTDNDGATELDRPLRRRRVRVRLRPRREPPRRQLADGDDHVRPPRRPRRRGVGALAHDDRRAGVGRARRRARSCKELLDRTTGERPWKIRDELGDVDARELRRLPPRGADAEAARDHRRSCASATGTSTSRTRATSSTATSRRRSSSATCSTPRSAWSQAGIARKESRGAHSRPHDYPTRDDENFMHHSIARWTRRRRRAVDKPTCA